ncbi:translation machinery-associated protein 20 [Dipodascopsis tothii]|uniref:translation machinery-associated protein 20 n=1 Tax=Dipodascopsis tothii TaxID=44089 RepID=UPI0034CFDCDF
MFKKFTREEVHSKTNVKSSVQRSIKSKLVAQFPGLEPVIDEVIPKKSQLALIKCENRISLFTIDDDILLIQHYDDPFLPSIRLVHRYPEAFPSVRVDRGAIKFILSGANIMCPGLTSAGAALPAEPIAKGSVVAITAQGKDSALAVGTLLMGTDEIKAVNKGVGVEVGSYLGDGLWNFTY